MNVSTLSLLVGKPRFHLNSQTISSIFKIPLNKENYQGNIGEFSISTNYMIIIPPIKPTATMHKTRCFCNILNSKKVGRKVGLFRKILIIFMQVREKVIDVLKFMNHSIIRDIIRDERIYRG